MKTPYAVMQAESAVTAKAAELAAAQTAVKRLAEELAAAQSALTKARQDADADLPQCTLFQRARFGSGSGEAGRLVIVKKTPAGKLVVRRVGQAADATPWMFEWRKHSGVYCEKKARGSWVSAYLELRDVPAEFMPDDAAAQIGREAR